MARAAGKRSSNVSEKPFQVIEKNYAYRVRIELEDYLFFSSMEKGKVAETAPLIHNYALAYAMAWANSFYYHEAQAPAYQRELHPLNAQGNYVYPAVPVHVTHRVMQYNTTDESLLMTRAQSMGIPNWGFIKCIRPGSVFETFVLTQEPVLLPSRIRLGKWMSQATLKVEEVSLTKAKRRHCPHMVNIRDLSRLPYYFSAMYNVLPTRLIQGAEWEEDIDGYQVYDLAGDRKETIFLPEAAFWRG
ncbi:type I-D CRISPR-associated protein Cas5/Csc1 [Lihuaxuella thermophila]|uniref:CRISPR-associated protein Csc1 n=1 Tax=Lihuaxuella thermophila TaxID=1173111 RepID=A0A1H8E5W3_9BACL|nr:type I-D CRISPR-associated protein Cas5/Csc1 [Lihuaxuella thermophila]SEN14971.1 CRISPR-associated protein Csc1 [Lihuaxuella thermophila]